MKKRIGALLIALAIIVGVFPQPMMAAPISGTAGEVINGDYVVIVNTNTDPIKTQSTGTLVFDGTNSAPVSSEPAQGAVNAVGSLVVPNTLAPEAATKTYAVGQSLFMAGKNFTVIGVGEKSYIWMESGMKSEYDAAGKTEAAAKEMISVYEGRPYDILNNLADGRIPYSDHSGKLSILMEDTGGSAGYFAGEQNITAIHVKAPPAPNYRAGSLESLNGLLVHEGQHALFNKLTCNGDALLAHRHTWFNEGLFVTAMEWTWGETGSSRWLQSINGDTDVRNGSALVYDDYRKTTALDYGMPFLFVRYLANQTSEKFAPMAFMRAAYKVSAVGKTDEQYIDEVLATAGLSMTFKEAIANFYVAAFAQERTGRYGFYGDGTVWNSVNDYPVYLGESGKATNLAGTAAIVVRTLDGKFTVPTDGGADIKYMAFNKTSDLLVPQTGTGTAEDPYIIKTPQELLALGAYPNASFKLGNSIDASGLVYYSADDFKGTLDGAGFTLSGLNQPLLGRNYGVVKNLNMVAGLTGEYMHTIGVVANYNSGTIADVSVTGAVNPKLTSSNYLVPQVWGTVVGMNEPAGLILRTYSDAVVTLALPANNGVAGNLVGVNQGRIENAYTRGEITTTQPIAGNYYTYVGGAVGQSKPFGFGASLVNIYSITTVSGNGPGLKQGRIIGAELGNMSARSLYGLEGMAMSGTGPTINDGMVRTSAQLKEAGTFENWPFDAVWKLNAGDYPVFGTSDDIQTLSGELSKKTYFVGENLELFGATLTINGTTKVPITADMLDVATFDHSKPGETTISGIYKDKPFTLKATIIEPTSVENLKIVEPGKTAYLVGEDYSQEGVVLTANINGLPYVTRINTGFTNDKDNPLGTADTSVTYTYGGKTVSQPITVREKSIAEMTLITGGKSNYSTGETLDLGPVRVQLTYDDGTKSPLISVADFADYGIHVSRYKNDQTSAFDSEARLGLDDHEAVFYLYIGDQLPNNPGVINTYLLKASVVQGMTMADETIVYKIGKDGGNWIWSNAIEGGSENYSTTLKSGTLPAWAKVERPSSFNSSFQFSGEPTTPSETVVVYTVKDNVTAQTIDVTFTIIAAPISSEAKMTSLILTKAMNPGTVSNDVAGVIDDEKGEIVFYLPEGTDVTRLKPTPIVHDGGTLPPNRWNGNVINFTNPVDYTVTSEDGTTTKTYRVKVVFGTAPAVPVTTEETKTEPVDFETEYVDDPALDKGVEEVRREGVKGERTIVETVTTLNGVETSRVEKSNTITTEPVNKLIARGTKVTPIPVITEEIKTEPVDFETEYVDDPALDKGVEEVRREGVKGERTIVETVTTLNGVETSRVEKSNTITTEAVNKLIARGTKVTPIPMITEETKTEPVDFETEYVDDPTLDKGVEEVRREGVKGERTIVETVTTLNGVETSRVEKSNEITTEPVNKLIARGTKVTPVPVITEETKTEPVDFETDYVDDPALDKGVEEVRREGVKGERTIVETVTTLNGIETSRVEKSNTITTEPVNKLIARGTKVTPIPVITEEIKTEPVDFETEYVDDPALDKGVEEVRREGVKGERTIIETVTTLNGVETSRVEKSNEITTEPVNKLIARGTKVTPVPVITEETKTEPVDFETEYVYDPTLDKGVEEVRREGVKGERTIIETVTTLNGVETSRVEKSNEITTEPVNQIIAKGTKVTPEMVVKEEMVTGVSVPFEIEYIDDDTLLKGTEQVEREGVDGEKTVQYLVTFLEDREIAREVKEETVTKKPVNKVIRRGTKEAAQDPIIIAKDRQVFVGDKLDLLAGVTAIDGKGRDLTSEITVEPKAIDTNKAGTHEVTYTVTDGDGNTATLKITIRIIAKTPDTGGGVVYEPSVEPVGVEPGTTTVERRINRISGEDRFSTAVKVSQRTYNSAKVAIIVNGHSFPDALTATAFADLVGGPILLVNKDSVPAQTASELKRLGAEELVIIGGTSAVGESVEKQLKTDFAVERIGGADRYETSALIYDRVVQITGDKGQVIISRGDDFPDALAISALAIKEKSPILLVRPMGVPSEVKVRLDQSKPKDIVIVGLTSAVSNEVEAQLKAYGAVKRLGGINRYETATVVAKYTYPNATEAIVASGEVFIDALTAGPLTNDIGGPILLVGKAQVPKEVKEYLSGEGSVIKTLNIIGGTNAVSEQNAVELAR